MQLVAYVFVFIYLILLILALSLIANIYICDNGTCIAYTRTANITDNTAGGPALLGQIGIDGIWPFAYIGALLISGMMLWLLGVPIDAKIFTLALIVSFIWIYVVFMFFIHHYLQPIVAGVKKDLTNPSVTVAKPVTVNSIKPIITYVE